MITPRKGTESGLQTGSVTPNYPTAKSMLSLPRMDTLTLTPEQLAIVEAPPTAKLFVSGSAGCGKTTAAVARLRHLIESGYPAERILVLTPQRTLAEPYQALLRDPSLPAGGYVDVATLGGLARRMVALFWPLVAREAGFAHPERPPIFLTLETAQYYMAHVVEPRLAEGYFESITLDRNRLYSQLLDNLNKAAVNGLPVERLAERLKSAWIGEKAQRRVYDEMQDCVNAFRAYCLEHNLLDFSLQVELFTQRLWVKDIVRYTLLNRYTLLIADNLEEDVPITHDLLHGWLPHAQGALLVVDEEGGYRLFLGAAPEGALTLARHCEQRLTLHHSFVARPPVQALRRHVTAALRHQPTAPDDKALVRQALNFKLHRYHPQMLDWVAEEIARLVHAERVPPREIVVLAPFLSDALRFTLSQRLQARSIPVRSHRPSRALREEAAAQALLTLTALAHPQWGVCPSREDVSFALMQAIAGLDWVRAHLLAGIVYRVQDGAPQLTPFARIQREMQERITYLFGGRYEALREWLEAYHAGPPVALDHFLSRLFGEALSQPGYGFHRNPDAANAAARLVESARKFRQVAPDTGEAVGLEYLRMVEQGVIAAQYLTSWQDTDEDAVLLAPAYTFLMRNKPVRYQFWLEIGARGWWERLYQPLTHPYVLSRSWEEGRPWTAEEEFKTRQETLARLVTGLLNRCREGVILGLSELGEEGFEERGPLLQAVQAVLRRMSE